MWYFSHRFAVLLIAGRESILGNALFNAENTYAILTVLLFGFGELFHSVLT